MKTILQIKLLPTDTQAAALLETMHRVNAACDHIAFVAWEQKCFGKFALQKLVYHDVKERFDLAAQMVIRAIQKVADAYKLDRKAQRTFRPLGAITYDQRIMSFKSINKVSLWTVEGRQALPFVHGLYQKKRWHQAKGQADLVCKDGKFYLLISTETEEQEPVDPEGYLGVDLGIKNIATDSDGEVFASGKLNALRNRYAKLRAKLQSKGSRPAKRLLRRRKAKESRMARDVNHCIAKKLVAKAEGTRRGIALEDLKGIRERMTVKKAQRRIHHSWAFSQLRQFVEYKAKLAGVLVSLVDPRNTSRECPDCGHIAKENRPTQSLFLCRCCGFSGHADTIAAGNISRRAVVMRPDVALAV